MSVISLYATAQLRRKVAVEGLQHRKTAREYVSRVHKLPALGASDVDELFKTAFPDIGDMPRAA